MISVIYSTRKTKPDFKNHILNTIGIKNCEVIEYVNDGEYSLTEIYNKGISDSQNDIVVFCHDDIAFNTKKWGTKLINHFEKTNYGVLGVAGTTDLPSSGKWWEDQTKMVGIVKHASEGKSWESKYCPSFGEQIIETVIVDGLFIAVNKKEIKSNFNEDVKGFHFYDVDFCFNNFINGVKIGVLFNIKLTHFSVGETNESWEKNRESFIESYKEHLPCNIKGDILLDNKEIKLKKKPKVGIIIPTKSNLDLLFNCIDSFYEKDDYENIVVYVADTGSSVEEVKEIKTYIKNKNKDINLLIYDYYNFAKINNDVVKNHVSEDVELLLFCNNDIKLINNAITRVVNVYLKNKNVGTIGARLHFGDNTIQHSGMTLLLQQNNNNTYSVVLTHHGFKSYYNYHITNREVLGNTGAFLLINKKLFNNIGQFSEEYSECFEDVELNVSCLLRNKKNIFVENAVCYHYESQTRNKDKNKLFKEGQDYQKIIPKIIRNRKTYPYFVNAKVDVLEQIFREYNARTTN